MCNFRVQFERMFLVSGVFRGPKAVPEKRKKNFKNPKIGLQICAPKTPSRMTPFGPPKNLEKFYKILNFFNFLAFQETLARSGLDPGWAWAGLRAGPCRGISEAS